MDWDTIIKSMTHCKSQIVKFYTAAQRVRVWYNLVSGASGSDIGGRRVVTELEEILWLNTVGHTSKERESLLNLSKECCHTICVLRGKEEFTKPEGRVLDCNTNLGFVFRGK